MFVCLFDSQFSLYIYIYVYMCKSCLQCVFMFYLSMYLLFFKYEIICFFLLSKIHDLEYRLLSFIWDQSWISLHALLVIFIARTSLITHRIFGYIYIIFFIIDMSERNGTMFFKIIYLQYTCTFIVDKWRFYHVFTV